MMIRQFLLWVTVLFFGTNLWSQREITITVDWNTDDPSLLAQNITYKDQDVFYEWKMKKSSKSWALQFISYTSVPASTSEIKELNERNINIPDAFVFKRNTTDNREQLFESVKLSPYIKVNSNIRKITSVTATENPNYFAPAKNRDFKAHSALQPGSGDWYKIKVTQDGVHVITYDFLQSIGVNVNNLNPDHINIFGNGFGELPYENYLYRPDDIIKNAIEVIGGNDGSFDPGDKILFYGKGPNRWQRLGSIGFERIQNHYSDYSAYFININASETPLRISNAQTTTAAATHTVTSFNDFARHEKEEVNLIHSGRRWYGEKFDVELSQNFSFNLPNVDPNAPAALRYAIAYNSGDNTSTFDVNYNGNTISSNTINSWTGGETAFGRKVVSVTNGDFIPTSGNITLNCILNRNLPSMYAYLDFLEVNVKRQLKLVENQMDFRDIQSVGNGNIANFQISNYSSAYKIWEVTDNTQPSLVNGNVNGNTYSFSVNADSLREFIAFNGNYLTPSFIEKVNNQDLHGLGYADYLIITHPLFKAQALRLAKLHESEGLSYHLVDINDIYNEFSGGAPDITAIRMFAKMFYDRANGDPNLMPKYMCLFGDGTYDPKNRVEDNNNMIPTYQALNSEHHITSQVSDDYFGLLGDNEGMSSSDDLDIAIGRLIVTTELQAKQMVDKIEHYMKNGSNLFATSSSNTDANGYSSTQGSWRLNYALIADDMDKTSDNFLTGDIEPFFNYVETNHPMMNANKIYLDAFTQKTSAAGERYPEVNEMINRNFASGNLVMTYIGHGGEAGLAQERILTNNQINALTNIDRLPLFVSATCEFTRFDNNKVISAGEYLYLNPKGGAIALMTTTRSVYIDVNSIINIAFYQNVFKPDNNGNPQTLGEIIRLTKNQAATTGNKRCFTLIGDPALRLALPRHKVVIDSINGYNINTYADTLRALSTARVSGHLEDINGNPFSYNGVIENTIFDKKKDYLTLGNDLASPTLYQQQVNKLYKGKSTVTDGKFSYEFIVPKDINYNFGFGKASDYFYNSTQSAGGENQLFYVGGIDTNGIDDNIGPEIEVFLNDESFVNGGLSDETPILKATLFDESGINTVGNGIGHNITVIIDEKSEELIVLNDFYEADLDTYKSGTLSYQLNRLEPGRHTLTFKAWDVNNNSSEKTIEFIVQEKEEIALKHVLNYPNPFTTSTEFFFEHNQVSTSLETQIEIYTVSGILVKTINKEVLTDGFRSEGIKWDGLDEFGDQLAKGLYIYKIKVRTADGKETSVIEKLYLL
ncbi:Peptidase family C25 [Lishizhenia tianjinensis]|uniref:Peptidase family C25 n=1 Tax=Lishizhenia tianjinensis TaxID=477690 RepID=A0A1I7AND4_9FLAO|nr:type IX secretion system sortase PorU [Lishizhenia tianjinensis]SFT76376.1 Peptidase family C25 [Lishizhenia tianjinensis]